MILREMFEAEIKHGKGQRPWVTLQDENDKDRHRELIDAAGDDGKIRLLQRRGRRGILSIARGAQ